MTTSANQHSTRFDAEGSAGGTPAREGSHISAETARVTPFPSRTADGGRLSGETAEIPVHSEEKRSMRTLLKPAMLVLAAVIAGVVAWIALRDPAAKPAAGATAPTPIELAAVDVASVAPQVVSRSLPLSGTIAPFVQATVKSKVGGEVEQVALREGQDVRDGDVIARIDTRNLRAQYDRELAAVEKARADLDLARLNRDKNRVMLEQKFISQNTYESTESAYAGSVASLKLAEAQARVAQISLEDAVIRAPFSGTIAKRMVQPGEKVSMDSPVVSLVDLRQMVLEAAVPAAEIPSVREGQKARFRVGGFGDREFEGEVQRINPLTADGSRAITIYIAVPNKDRALKGGMFAQGALTLDANAPVLAIAQRAVRDDAGTQYVYSLRDGKIVRTPVTLGPMIKGNAYVEVREGLAEGDRIIVADIGNDKAGVSATVRPADGGTANVEREVAATR
jgi:RND family efflux transporter MFP subunit